MVVRKKSSKKAPTRRKGSEVIPSNVLPAQDYRTGPDPQEVIEEVKSALMDPLDLRTDKQLMDEYGISRKVMLSLQRSSTVRSQGLSNLRESMPDITMKTVKAIQRGVESGSISAAKLVLELSGLVKTTGDTNVFLSSSNSPASPARSMSDAELEGKIRTLLTATYPKDVQFTEIGVEVMDPSNEELYPGIADGSDLSDYQGRTNGVPEASVTAGS